MKLHEILHAAEKEHGFLTEAQVNRLAEIDRLRLLLVRCGAKRFLAHAQDVADMISAVEQAGDYIRDVSLPTSDPIWQGRYTFVTPQPDPPSVTQPVWRGTLGELVREVRQQRGTVDYGPDYDYSYGL